MLLGLIVLAPARFGLVPYHASVSRRVRLDARAYLARTSDPYSVLIDGHPVGGAPENAQVRPARCFRPGGVAYNVTGVVSGAYTISTDLGVVAWPGTRKGFPDAIVRGVARDGAVLLTNDDQAPSQEALQSDRAWIDRAGRRTEIGPVDEVWMLPDGSVLGRAYRNPKGGYANRSNQPEGTTMETFLWRGGHRLPSGGWWPMDVNAKGVAVGFGRDAQNLRDPEAYWTGPLVRWEKGRLTPLDLRGYHATYPIVARDDGSFVLGVALGKDDARLAILGERGLEVLPRTIGGKAIDPRLIEVDERGRIHFYGEGYARWQIVRL